MKKSLVLSLVCVSLIYGKGFVNPLPISSRSIDNGGLLSAIDAYQDGVGVMVLEQGRGIDNSVMNSLVFKYGTVAKNNGLIISEQIILSGTLEDKILLSKIYQDGGDCIDENPLTQGETWLNGVCQGGSIPDGLLCNDNNIQTINDIYTNGICSGTNVQGHSCSDNNVMTINDTWNNGICSGTLTVNGQSCDDQNAQTINDVWNNGICAGTQIAPEGSQIFTTSGTFTVPFGWTTVRICMVGGGGGGNSGTNSYPGEHGGGYAGVVISKNITVTSGQQISVTIGSGGSGAIANRQIPNPGTASRFGNEVANGGGTSSANGNGELITTCGGTSNNGTISTGRGGISSGFGKGGNGTSWSSIGNSGGVGSGGGGNYTNSTGATGGSGGRGEVRVYWGL